MNKIIVNGVSVGYTAEGIEQEIRDAMETSSDRDMWYDQTKSFQREIGQLKDRIEKLEHALRAMDKLTYSFDSRKRMEQIRKDAGVN